MDGYVPTNSNQYTARENDGLVGGTAGGALYYYRARYYDPVLKRFISEDPIGLLGGYNTYAYTEGNPSGATDPLGLLSGPQHVTVTLDAFEGTAFSGQFAWQVAGANMGFDSVNGSQSPELAYTHAMRAPNQSPFENAQKWRSFIRYQIGLCTAGGLGWALHASQDFAAGGHAGFQEFKGIWHLIFFDQLHFIQDHFPSSRRREQAVRLSREVIKEFQRQCGCR